MRQIALDTETTGLLPQLGHRIIEIGCVELIDRQLTGNHFHVYLNPERQIEEEALRVHGITNQFLADKPLFKDIVSDFMTFIQKAELIIHNAPFDVGFLESELKACSAHYSLPLTQHCTILDTLVLAREKHPGRCSLDALCKRYKVDNSKRIRHGALLDAEILARVYLAMTSGQVSLFEFEEFEVSSPLIPLNQRKQFSMDTPIIYADAIESQRHENFIRMLVKKSGINLWQEEKELVT